MSTPDFPASVSSSLTRTTIRDASTESTIPPRLAMTVTPESTATARSIPVPTSGVSVLQRRHGLALHVRAHQCAVSVIVLQERYQRRSHRNDLLRRDVHVLDLVRGSIENSF